MQSSNHPEALSQSIVPLTALVLLSINTLVWGLNWPIQKIALSILDPWTLRMLTAGIGGLGMLLIAAISTQSLAIPRNRIGLLILNGLLTTTGAQMLSAYGVYLINPGRAAILMFTFPMWAMLLSIVLLRARITLWQGLGVALGMGGILLLLVPDLKSVSSSPLGSIFIILASISWAAGSILTQRYSWGMPTLVLTGWQSTIGSIPIVIIAVTTQPLISPLSVSLDVSLAVLFAVFCSSLFGMWAWFKVLTLSPAHVASVGLLAVPIVGVFTSTLLLGDPLLWNELGALVLVCSSIAIVLVLPALRRRSTSVPPS